MKLVDEVINNIDFRVEGDASILTIHSSTPVEYDSMETPISRTCEVEPTACENANVIH